MADNMDEYAKQIHAPVRRVKEHRQVVVNGPNDIWTSDAINLTLYEKDKAFAGTNDGYMYASVWMDCFTRYAYAVPQKRLTAEATWTAFEEAMAQARAKPRLLWVDQGSDYTSKYFKAKAKAAGITVYHVFTGESKAAMAERLNRTIIERLFRMMTARQSRRWIDILPDVMRWYNDQHVHAALGMTPAAAAKLSPAGQQELWLRQYGHVSESAPATIAVGSWVRISRARAAFDKRARDGNWSTEPFEVVRIRNSSPPLYFLRDLLGEDIAGGFYSGELQYVGDERPTTFLVESVLKRRTVRGQKQVLVRWLGLPPKFDSWIDDDATVQRFDNSATRAEAVAPEPAPAAVAEPTRKRARAAAPTAVAPAAAAAVAEPARPRAKKGKS